LVWLAHDVTAIESLFSTHALYVIRNKHLTLIGVPQIQAYWRRNSKRQQNLRLEWFSLPGEDPVAKARFRADFFDSEERESQLIVGTLRIRLDAQGRIERLSESYQKLTYEQVS
jgi:hypothetical protein